MAAKKTVEPFFNEVYGYTVWDHPDYILVSRGDIRKDADVAVNPTYIAKGKNGKIDLATVFLTDVEVDVPGLSADDIRTEPVKVEEPEPEESLY